MENKPLTMGEEAAILRDIAIKAIRQYIKTAKVKRIVRSGKKYRPCTHIERKECREFLTKPSRELGILLDALDVDMAMFNGWCQNLAKMGWPTFEGEDDYDDCYKFAATNKSTEVTA